MNTLHPVFADMMRTFAPHVLRRAAPQPVEEICSICSGSGEGQFEGRSCGGSGVERVEA